MINDLLRIFDQGGSIMYAIAICSIIAWYLFLHNWQKIKAEKNALSVLEGKSTKPAGKAIFSEEINQYLNLKKSGCSEKEALVDFKKNLSVKLPKLEERIQVAGTFIQIMPLLGLLGTVCGMILTFEHQASASNNNDILAKGISQALYTTEYALLLAVPGVYIACISHRSIERLRDRYQSFMRNKIHEVSL